MKKRLVGKILTSLLVMRVGRNTLVLPVTHAKTPNPQAKPNTKKILYKLTAEELLPLAEQRDTQAQVRLGNMYYNGEDVPQDYKKAVYWYQKSAEQGCANAQCLLGGMYGVGRGIPQDYQRAYVWYSLGSAQGEKVSELRDLIAEKLTPAQLTQAQQWARGWHEKIQAKKAQTPE